MVALPLLDRGSGGSYATILEPLMRIFRSPAGLERSTCVINQWIADTKWFEDGCIAFWSTGKVLQRLELNLLNRRLNILLLSC